MSDEMPNPEAEEKQETAPHQASPVMAPEEALSKDESWFRQFARNAFPWVAGFLIIFGLGAITVIYAWHRPRTAELNQDLNAATSAIAGLEAQVSELEARVAVLEPLEAENQALVARSQRDNAQIAILRALSAVYAAKYALETGNPSEAGIQVEAASVALDRLVLLLPGELVPAVEPMQQRLSLALSGLETDAFAAQSDFDVLLNLLYALEEELPAP